MNSEHATEVDTKQKRHNVMWSNDEWSRIADMVWSMRKNRPGERPIRLAREAVKQVLPVERHRLLKNARDINPLLPLLKAKDEQAGKALHELPNLQQSVQSLRANKSEESKEMILDALTDEEIMVYFGDKVINKILPIDVIGRFDPRDVLDLMPIPNIVAYLAEKAVHVLMENVMTRLERPAVEETVIEKPQPVMGSSPHVVPTHQTHQTPTVQKPRLKRVLLVGALPQQIREIVAQTKDIVDVNALPKDRMEIPRTYDAYLLWGSFISHKQQEKIKSFGGKMIIAFGGVTSVVKAIREAAGTL